jgi:hypothetical protein
VVFERSPNVACRAQTGFKRCSFVEHDFLHDLVCRIRVGLLCSFIGPLPGFFNCLLELRIVDPAKERALGNAAGF